MTRQLRHCDQVMDGIHPRQNVCGFCFAPRVAPHLGALPPHFAILKRDFSGGLLAPVALRKGDRVRVTTPAASGTWALRATSKTQ